MLKKSLISFPGYANDMYIVYHSEIIKSYNFIEIFCIILSRLLIYSNQKNIKLQHLHFSQLHEDHIARSTHSDFEKPV